MEITTAPSCRVGWQGATLHYVIKAQGASEVLVPENGMKGVQVRVTSTRQVGDGVEAQVALKVLDSTLY
jgi:hypothetical protein